MWYTKATLTLDVVTEILYKTDRKMFLAAYLPSNEAEDTAATEAELHGKMSKNELWAMMFALIFFALLSLRGTKTGFVGRAINCELRNHQFQCAQFPFSSIRREVIAARIRNGHTHLALVTLTWHKHDRCGRPSSFCTSRG